MAETEKEMAIANDWEYQELLELQQIVEMSGSALRVIDKDFNITRVNQTFADLVGVPYNELIGSKCYDSLKSPICHTPDCLLTRIINGEPRIQGEEEKELRDGTKIPCMVTATPLMGADGKLFGIVEEIKDIRELKNAQVKALSELATPIMLLWNKMLLLPIIGTVDSKRAQMIMETILTKIAETESKVIIMDILGVQTVDTAVANHLIKITRATKIMGCDCIITGVSPVVAQTIVQLGVDLRSVITQTTLKDGLAYAYELLGYELREMVKKK